jgi:hypothetical protein
MLGKPSTAMSKSNSASTERNWDTRPAKALAFGATAVGLGRTYLYALAVGGVDGPPRLAPRSFANRYNNVGRYVSFAAGELATTIQVQAGRTH